MAKAEPMADTLAAIRYSQRVRSIAVAVLVGCIVAGCGIRGSLEPPPGAKAEAKAQTSKADPNAPKPHRDFVLDGLIR